MIYIFTKTGKQIKASEGTREEIKNAIVEAENMRNSFFYGWSNYTEENISSRITALNNYL